jgi:DNA-binding GntR family transcriptional regulator
MGASTKSGVAASRSLQVYRTLRRAILDQGLKPGVKLPEDAIGERLGVSRTIVRDALARLGTEGLVELKHNRGAAVAYPSLEEARDVFAVRRAMERLVVEELAGRLTSTQCERLRSHVDEERDAKGRDSLRLAGEFHLMLAEMTGNQLLARLVTEVASRCTLILSIYGRPHSSECAVDEHSELIAALEAGDREQAVSLMEHHLSSVMDRALIERKPEDDLASVLATYGAAEGFTLGAKARVEDGDREEKRNRVKG